LYVDGASSQQGSGVGVAVISPQDNVLNYALHLIFPVTNNIAELYSDSQLVKELELEKFDYTVIHSWLFGKLTKEFEFSMKFAEV
jgi:hypothetical protein